MKKNQKSYTAFDLALTTALYAGLSPWAPGTMGAAVGVAVWWLASLWLPFAALQWATLGCILLFTLLSVPSIRRMERAMGEDPSCVVIDEVVGVWIGLLAVAPAMPWWQPLLAFGLFRLFDIWKPLGVRRMERVGGGWGVMLDDILAGVYAAAVLAAVVWLVP